MLVVGDPHRGAAWAAPRAVLPADQYRRPRLQPLGAGALVFAGVLVIVLAAVETTRTLRTPPLPVVWGAIVASLVMAYVIHPAWLLGWPFWPRLIVACVIGFLPVYLANIAFAKRFAASDHAQSAFAINLLGAILGGCLEYGALVTGYRNLLIVVGVLYLLAFLLTPKRGGALVSV